MDNDDIQEKAQREESLAGGPVSAGASNTEVSGNDDSATDFDESSTKGGKSADYDKLIQSNASGTTLGSNMATGQGPGSPGGGSLPTESPDDSTRGGINTSSDTVSGGSSSAGGIAGQGNDVDRGSSADTDLDATTNTEDEETHQSTNA